MDKLILDFFKKATKRVRINYLINFNLFILKYLLCFSFVLLVTSLFITLPYVEEISIIVVLVGIIVANIYGIIKGPDKRKVALIVDSKGLDERVITSLELIGKNDAIAIAQKENTVEVIKSYDIKKNLKITLDKGLIVLLTGLLTISFLVAFVPTPAKDKANRIREFNKQQSQMVKKIEEEKKEIEKVKALNEIQKKELKEILEAAKKEIKESDNKSNIDKTLERLEKKLQDKREAIDSKEGKKALDNSKKNLFQQFNKEKEEVAKKDINKLVNELMKKKESEALADAILSGEEDKINKALEDLKSEMNNMSTSELSKLSEALKEAAAKISDTELKEALENAANSTMDGELDTSKLSQALATVKNNSNGNSGNGQQGGESAGGSAQGQGSGTGQGQGQGGSGQGSSGSGSGSGTGWNTGSTQGKENDIDNKRGEEVFIPGRDEGSDGNLSGNKNNDGDSQTIETEAGLNKGGSKIDYDKVIDDYTNSALDGVDSSNLPESLKELIRDYFNGLN